MESENKDPKLHNQKGVILAFTEDLFIEPRLQDAARHLGYTLQVIGDPDSFGPAAERVGRAVPLTEPLLGPDAAYIRWLAAIRPGLLLFDTSSARLPWAHWIQIAKTSAATRRIPVLAFGPHVKEASLELARQAGADKVVTRGQFQRGLAGLLRDWVRVADLAALAAACDGTISELASRGIKAHNAGHFFEAHEDLEHAWMEAGQMEGYLYRALLQVTVAHLHLERGNPAGATKLLMRIHQWLDPLPDHCRGVDLSRLRSHVEELRVFLFQYLDQGDAGADDAIPFPFTIVLECADPAKGGS